MRIVLHIGLEKTGTTSIQAHCHRHAETLRAQGILYPAWLGYRNHADLVIAAAAYGSTVDMRTRAGVGSERELAAFRMAALGRLRQQVAKARPACLLLSDEHFSSRCGDAEVRRLKEMLAEFSDRSGTAGGGTRSGAPAQLPRPGRPRRAPAPRSPTRTAHALTANQAMPVPPHIVITP